MTVVDPKCTNLITLFECNVTPEKFLHLRKLNEESMRDNGSIIISDEYDSQQVKMWSIETAEIMIKDPNTGVARLVFAGLCRMASVDNGNLFIRCFLKIVQQPLFDLVKTHNEYREIAVCAIVGAVSRADGHSGFHRFSESKFFAGLLDVICAFDIQKSDDATARE